MKTEGLSSVSQDVAAMKAANEQQAKSRTVYEVDRTPLLAFPARIFDMWSLTVLRLSSCGLKHLPRRLALLTQLQTLNVSDNPLEDFPDLCALLQLENLDTSGTSLMRKVPVYGWDATRETLLLFRKEYHCGGLSNAVRTLLCIRAHCPDTHFSRCVARDIVLIIGKMLWADRRAPEWKVLNKRAHDLEVFHCMLPVPFATAFGPSCFRCECGFAFGDPLSPDVSLDALRAERAKHFVVKYQSDLSGRCTRDSIHLPLNCAVQHVCGYGRNKRATVRTRDMVSEVIQFLIEKGSNIAYPLPAYACVRSMMSGSNGGRNPNKLFASVILDDVEACLDDYLAMRAKSQLPPKWFYGVFADKAEAEQALLTNNKEACRLIPLYKSAYVS
jgi:hypothetical protein